MNGKAEIDLFLSIIESSGVIGILVIFLWAFLSGQIISRKMLDEIIDGYVRRTDERFERAVREIINEIRSEIRKRSF